MDRRTDYTQEYDANITPPATQRAPLRKNSMTLARSQRHVDMTRDMTAKQQLQADRTSTVLYRFYMNCVSVSVNKQSLTYNYSELLLLLGLLLLPLKVQLSI